MGYRVLADAAMVTHFAFLVYVTLGGFLAWRWPVTIVPHVAAVVWGLLIVNQSVNCPLTAAETWARLRAGQQGLPSAGFIDHYLEDVVYPERYTGVVRAVVVVIVAGSWLGAYLRRRTP